MDDFNRRLREAAEQIDIAVSEDQAKQFFEYYRLLVEWNEKINLTSITAMDEVISKHFIDSATFLLALSPKPGSKLLDLGTGAGFPGLPLKIIRPDFNVFLVDSLRKRVDFLRLVIESLKLDKVEAIHARAEELGKQKGFRESFDLVTSRAVAKLSILAEYCLPFCKVGGHFIALKGPNIKEEIEASKKALAVLGGELTEIKELLLPVTGEKRNLLIIHKKGVSPSQYPRKAGTPERKPI